MLALLWLALTIAALARADDDVEDLIARGYTCSRSSERTEFGSSVDGTRIICDDGLCFECVLTEKRPQSFLQGADVDVEDYLKAGYTCTQDRAARTPQAGVVCDDGRCYRCTDQPLVSVGGRGDVEDYLEDDYTCFLMAGIPKEAFKDDVVVICDDGECFGCMNNVAPVTQNAQGSSTDRYEQFAVTKRFIDEAEDLLEDYNCGLTITNKPSNNQRTVRTVCEGSLCLVCSSDRKDLVPVTRNTVEVVEDLLDTGYRCSAVLEKVKGTSTASERIVCDREMCFICN